MPAEPEGEKRAAAGPGARLPRDGPADIPVLRAVGGPDLLRYVRLEPGRPVEIGSAAPAGLLLSATSVAPRHARLLADEGTVTLEDLGSATGTLVNGERMERATLRDGDRVVVGGVPLRFDLVRAEELAHLKRVLERLHSRDRDPATGLLTAAFLDDGLPSLLDQCARTSRPISVVLAELDRPGAAPPGRPRPGEDVVLRQAARLLVVGVRERDSCVRLAGDRLLVLLEGATEARAAAVAERLRASVAGHEWAALGEGLSAGLACGTATWSPGEPVRAWVARAEAALAEARRSGAGVCRASELPPIG